MPDSSTQAAQKKLEAKLQRESRPPYMGAIVLYVDPGMGDVAPAIVNTVFRTGNAVGVTVFQPGMTPFPTRGAVSFNVDRKTKGTWHWPIEEEPCLSP
jgi:hypothetical protein